ncbi:MAG: KEOPS complex subunit Pcc1 [Candidatus Njordarchaeota archaeon]
MVSKKFTDENSDRESDTPQGRIEICIEFGDERHCNIFFKALKPETINPPSYRSNVKIIAEDGSLKIEICSKDLVSLRAAINSYLRWISLILATIEEIEDEFGRY